MVSDGAIIFSYATTVKVQCMKELSNNANVTLMTFLSTLILSISPEKTDTILLHGE